METGWRYLQARKLGFILELPKYPLMGKPKKTGFFTTALILAVTGFCWAGMRAWAKVTGKGPV